MSEAKITLTREDLHEKIWTAPMWKLATEFGFSDRGLAKAPSTRKQVLQNHKTAPGLHRPFSTRPRPR